MTQRMATWIGPLAGLATIISCVFGGLAYFGPPTSSGAPAHSESANTAPGKLQELVKGGAPNAIGQPQAHPRGRQHPLVALPAPQHERVALGYTVAELREANAVREMMPLEEGQELSNLAGVYGFVHYLRLPTVFGPQREIDFPMNREQSRKGVEVHKTAAGDVTVLIHVDESTAARLGIADDVGTVFGFFRPFDAHHVLIGLPVGRISTWEHRTGGEGGFAEIRID